MASLVGGTTLTATSTSPCPTDANTVVLRQAFAFNNGQRSEEELTYASSETYQVIDPASGMWDNLELYTAAASQMDGKVLYPAGDLTMTAECHGPHGLLYRYQPVEAQFSEGLDITVRPHAQGVVVEAAQGCPTPSNLVVVHVGMDREIGRVTPARGEPWRVELADIDATLIEGLEIGATCYLGQQSRFNYEGWYGPAWGAPSASTPDS